MYGKTYKGVIIKRRRIIHTDRDVLDVIDEIDEFSSNTKSKSKRSRHDSKNSLNIFESTRTCRDDNDDASDNEVWELTNIHVIIKASSWDKLRLLRGKHMEDPLKEIQAMQLPGGYHPHIIHSPCALQDDHYLYNITPYCANGDLYGVVIRDITTQKRGNEDNAHGWFQQILLALVHLQQKGICHQNLSLENAMVHERTCKIIDFGLVLRTPYMNIHLRNNHVTDVSDYGDGSTRLLMTAQGQCGDAFTYMAPEILCRDPYFDGFAIDLYAAGIILYIMLVDHKPFKWAHKSDERFMNLAVHGRMEELLSYEEIDVSLDAVHLLQNLLWEDLRK